MKNQFDVRPHVVSSLAAALDADGSFVLAPPTFGAMPLIPPERAREIAQASVPVCVPLWNDLLQRSKRPELDPHRLVLAPDVWYADTPHEPLAPEYEREQVYAGPWYVMHANVDEEPRVHIEVSALARDVAVANGRFAEPEMAMGYVHGSPVLPDIPALVSPEQASTHLCAATGAKVAEMPVLLRRSGGWAAAASLWRLALDRDLDVITTNTTGNWAPGRRSQERVIFVGPALALYVPSLDQGPVARMCTWTEGGQHVELPLRPGMAQRYDEVELTG